MGKLESGAAAAALVTGGGAGIGQAIVRALAQKGLRITILDLDEESGKESVRLVEEEHAKLGLEGEKPAAIFIRCNVADRRQLAEAFAQHERVYGRLDVCVNNAGLAEKQGLLEDESISGIPDWVTLVNVNLIAVIDGTRLAVQLMRRTSRPGVILNIGSLSGVVPFVMPVYSSTKAGVVMFTRSLKSLVKEGIRVNVLCPEFVDTAMVRNAKSFGSPSTGLIVKFSDMKDVVSGAMELIEDESKHTACLLVTAMHGSQYWYGSDIESKFIKPSLRTSGQANSTVGPAVVESYRKIIIHTLSRNFGSASKIVTVPFKPPVKSGHLLVKVLYAGVNASDVNFSAGMYHGVQVAKTLLPFDAGFESVGIVAGLPEVDAGNNNLTLGAAVALMSYGGFAEYMQVPIMHAMQVPAATPEMVAILTSGLTASIGLEKAGQMKTGEIVLVTAAAGGTGQFAVQLAKLAGNRVVAVCGGSQKADLLRSFGVDRVIDYKNEDVKSVLKSEFPKGVDLIYESVGGDMFRTCMEALAVFGRLIVIGMISQYQGSNGWQPGNYPGLAERILAKSQTVVGFFLIHYAQHYKVHLHKLHKLYVDNKLNIAVDPTSFVGLESVAIAVDYLHSGRSVGKVIVRVAADADPVNKSRL